MTSQPLLIDTHTHLDFPDFDHDLHEQINLASQQGIKHIIIAGYIEEHFDRILKVQKQVNNKNHNLCTHVALGLHPFFVKNHHDDHLNILENTLRQHEVIAIGEIGLDTFTPKMKQECMISQQKYFFIKQLDLAVKYHLPVLLHIRKTHAESLKILKQHDYNAHELGGIAHSFSGGEQEAIAFVSLGFKLGVTGQICNPNARKLRKSIISVVKRFGIKSLVIETDCPDMTPLPCQQRILKDDTRKVTISKVRNNPSNLTYVLSTLSELLSIDQSVLANQLWQNSCSALKKSFEV